MSKLNRLLGSMTFSPLLWGMVASSVLVSAARSGALSGPLPARFLAGHGASQIVLAMFLAGLGTLAMRWLGLGTQRKLLDQPLLDAIPAGGQPLADCDTLLTRLEDQPAAVRDTYLVRRLRELLEYVYRKGSADTIEDEMRYRADVDRTRLHEGYALARRFTGATFAAGVLASAVALADALTNETSLAVAANLLGLGALLGGALLLAAHVVEQQEKRLLTDVDARVSAELVGRFELAFNPAAAPEVAILRSMGEQIARSSSLQVERQAEVWKESFVQVSEQWNQWSAEATRELRAALASSLAESLERHATTLAAAATAAAEQNTTRWNDVQQALLQNAEAVTLQQQELLRQGELLTQIIGATSQLEKLETELNRNLSTLAGAKNFEQTVLSLGAAIQLLNSKLGALPAPETPQVQLKPKRGSRAA